MGVGHIRTRGNIEIVQFNAGIEHCRDVPAIVFSAQLVTPNGSKGKTGKNRNTMISFLTANCLVRIACLSQRVCRKKLVDNFGFLQTENVVLVDSEESPHEIKAQAYRVNIPSSDFHDSDAPFSFQGNPRIRS